MHVTSKSSLLTFMTTFRKQYIVVFSVELWRSIKLTKAVFEKLNVCAFQNQSCRRVCNGVITHHVCFPHPFYTSFLIL